MLDYEQGYARMIISYRFSFLHKSDKKEYGAKQIT